MVLPGSRATNFHLAASIHARRHARALVRPRPAAT